MWGVTDEQGLVRNLCLSGKASGPGAGATSAALAQLCADRGLSLIDWCRTAKYSTKEDVVDSILK